MALEDEFSISHRQNAFTPGHCHLQFLKDNNKNKLLYTKTNKKMSNIYIHTFFFKDNNTIYKNFGPKALQ